MRIVVLAGGVGGSQFLWGLAQETDPEQLTAIVNTGDDIELHGLRISPDLDIVTYAMADLVDVSRGWGFAGDTFACMEVLSRYGQPTWFRLGDRDLATHLFRTHALQEGQRPTQIADAIRRALGVRARILPMTDDPMGTYVLIGDGAPRYVHFQEYLVERGAADDVRGLEYRGSARARPTPEILTALAEAEAIFIAPSNPLASIGPILAVPGIRRRLGEPRAPIVVVSPIVGGRSLKGPTDKFLRWAKLEVSPLGVAQFYQSVLGSVEGMLIDRADEKQASAIEALGFRVHVGDIIMPDAEAKRQVARLALRLREDL
jgi:LPPG:FO 2-phospho-L-lactate transferase